MEPKALGRRIAALVVGVTLAGAADTIQAQVAAPAPIAGYYSQKLKCTFNLEQISLQQYGTFTAVRIASQPDQYSPLRTIGLTLGDVVTRLDGTPITNYAELDRHNGQTYVRFIKQGTQQVQELMVNLDPPGGGPPPGGGTPP